MHSYVLSLKIPEILKEILVILEQQKFEAFIIGGCVRDSLLGLEPKDWDITTNATPSQIREIFIHKDFYIYEIAPQHGTLGLSKIGTHLVFEITTYRIDGKYSDCRRPNEIFFATNLKIDVSRRDFSINALACNLIHTKIKKEKLESLDTYILPKNTQEEQTHSCPQRLIQFIESINSRYIDTMKSTQIYKKYKNINFVECEMCLHDYFGGIEDLANKTIACVGNPYIRFQEDALRIMRCIRFHSTLPFGFSIHKKTYNALFALTPFLKNISKERICEEFSRLILGRYAFHTMIYYRKIIDYIFPLFDSFDKQRFCHVSLALQYAPKILSVRLAILLYPFFKENFIDNKSVKQYYKTCEIYLKTLRFSKKTIKETLDIIAVPNILPHNKIKLKTLLFHHGINTINSWLALRMALFYANKDLDESLLQHHEEYELFLLESINEWISVILEKKECYCLHTLLLNGKDLLMLCKENGVTLKGEEIGKMLEILVLRVIHDKCKNEKNQLLHEAQKLLAIKS
ncbi:hypothetical protein CQA53_05980 [Helicobacter didelphidarum]|uniref:Poly(A) polymerase n=1 Tax=Helicobacter didelphidarum TaxID=2040648 RepID=A0A3D8IK28_9HELI|nr:hypothetical protein [Helicobacter didelphidarum]RDU65707.1 hypothetical protein CQA53_05980 [Helicobacter didelphidarum]